jgi:hypothetical protein
MAQCLLQCCTHYDTAICTVHTRKNKCTKHSSTVSIPFNSSSPEHPTPTTDSCLPSLKYLALPSSPPKLPPSKLASVYTNNPSCQPFSSCVPSPTLPPVSNKNKAVPIGRVQLHSVHNGENRPSRILIRRGEAPKRGQRTSQILEEMGPLRRRATMGDSP